MRLLTFISLSVKMTRRIVLLLLLGLSAHSAQLAAQSRPDLQAVPKVDLTRYMGRWFEIAKYPARFERECDRDVTATYTKLENGEIEVYNMCVRENGRNKISKGKAHVADPSAPAKLKVTFFWPFFGDYWIIDLDPQYRWAVVGEPHRKYLWILSRVPHMDPATLAEIKSHLPQKGYDPGRLRPMKQSKR